MLLLLKKKNSENLTQAEKFCILSYIEIHIDSKLCYDIKMDEIQIPFKKHNLLSLGALYSHEIYILTIWLRQDALESLFCQIWIFGQSNGHSFLSKNKRNIESGTQGKSIQ